LDISGRQNRKNIEKNTGHHDNTILIATMKLDAADYRVAFLVYESLNLTSRDLIFEREIKIKCITSLTFRDAFRN
jgi:hypothetical protein